MRYYPSCSPDSIAVSAFGTPIMGPAMLTNDSMCSSVHRGPPFPPIGLSTHFRKYGNTIDPVVQVEAYQDLGHLRVRGFFCCYVIRSLLPMECATTTVFLPSVAFDISMVFFNFVKYLSRTSRLEKESRQS